LRNQPENRIPGTFLSPVKPGKNLTFSSYDGSFLVFFYVYASQFYDAFFFYHKAYFVMNFFMN